MKTDNNEWIPVQKALPTDVTNVIVAVLFSDGKQDYDLASWTKGGWVFCREYNQDMPQVTHWMEAPPLPAA